MVDLLGSAVWDACKVEAGLRVHRINPIVGVRDEVAIDEVLELEGLEIEPLEVALRIFKGIEFPQVWRHGNCNSSATYSRLI